MKTTPKVTPRGVTRPVEIYSLKRIAEFDEAEAELAKALGRKRSGNR